MKKQAEDWIKFAELGLLPDGLPTTEEAREFLEYAELIEAKIKSEIR
jgi:hypothetical protein